MSNPFNDIILRDWLFEDSSGLQEVDELQVMVTGDGPFSKSDLTNFLRKKSFLVFQFPTPVITTLIIGHEGWQEDDLLEFLRKNETKFVKIYSQEMFLSYLLTGICDPFTPRDPFNAPIEVLQRFAVGHPALEFLLGLEYFDWPSTTVSAGDHSRIDDSDWPDIGLMKAIGYRVGKSGINDKKKRQKLLEKIFQEKNLPLVQTQAYLDEWGYPRSCQRLKKMADSIATFCRRAKLNETKNMEVAISHWEMDLIWLKETFYQGVCDVQFSWPSTYVP